MGPTTKKNIKSLFFSLSFSLFRMDFNGNFVSHSLPDGSVSAPAQYFRGEPSTGTYREVTSPTTTAMAFSKRGTKRLRITDIGVDVKGVLTATSFTPTTITRLSYPSRRVRT